MGPTGAPATYARLKDITFGPIPGPNPEPPLIADLEERRGQVGFQYFFDDDYGAANTFEDFISKKNFRRDAPHLHVLLCAPHILPLVM